MRDVLMLQDPLLKQKLEENHRWTGIYHLFCLSDDMKSVVPVERLLKQDPEGILYIGTSDYLPNRVDNLRISITEAISPTPLQSKSRLCKHTCGKKYLNEEVQKKFPTEKLCIRIIGSDKQTHIDSHYILENEVIAKYESQFGEPPPLNEGRKS